MFNTFSTVEFAQCEPLSAVNKVKLNLFDVAYY